MGFDLPLETRNGKLRKVGMMMDNLTKMFNCSEIQDSWSPKVGDWTDKGLITKILATRTGYGQGKAVVLAKDGHEWHRLQIDLIYLPGIRQLMGMLPKDGDYKLQWNDGFDFMYPAGQGYYHYLHAKCPKEALLGGVMHELHGKEWDGERWI